MVIFRMLNSRTGRHELHGTSAKRFDIAHGIFVGELAMHHIRENLHIFVAVCTKAPIGLNQIIIDYANGTKAPVMFENHSELRNKARLA